MYDPDLEYFLQFKIWSAKDFIHYKNLFVNIAFIWPLMLIYAIMHFV